jgi:uncharacterized protein YqhQ
MDFHMVINFILAKDERINNKKCLIKSEKMNKIDQYLPFILWGISTIILTVIIFVVLPIILLWKGSDTYIKKEKVTTGAGETETKFSYAFSDTCLKDQVF